MPAGTGFATKPAPAGQMVTRAVAAGVPAAWVAGHEVYGADPRLRALIRGHRLGYVLGVSANRRVPTHAGPIRVDQLAALLPDDAWLHRSAGAGSTRPRNYSWAWIALTQRLGQIGDLRLQLLLARRRPPFPTARAVFPPWRNSAFHRPIDCSDALLPPRSPRDAHLPASTLSTTRVFFSTGIDGVGP